MRVGGRHDEGARLWLVQVDRAAGKIERRQHALERGAEQRCRLPVLDAAGRADRLGGGQQALVVVIAWFSHGQAD
jgi:hypothetical protein